jgi:pyridoxal/pyridoxine/pyridoxamine kinase
MLADNKISRIANVMDAMDAMDAMEQAQNYRTARIVITSFSLAGIWREFLIRKLLLLYALNVYRAYSI